MMLAVCLGGAAGGRASRWTSVLLGLRLVSLWSRWSSSLAERPWRFAKCVIGGVSGGRTQRRRCCPFLLSGVRLLVVGLCFV
jgi:hypothetical protein